MSAIRSNERALAELNVSREKVLLDAWAFYHGHYAYGVARGRAVAQLLKNGKRRSADRTRAYEQVLRACRLEARNAKYVMAALEAAIGRKPRPVNGNEAE